MNEEGKMKDLAKLGAIVEETVHRKFPGETQRHVAGILGMAPSSLAAIMKGKSYTLRLLNRACEGLDLDVVEMAKLHGDISGTFNKEKAIRATEDNVTNAEPEPEPEPKIDRVTFTGLYRPKDKNEVHEHTIATLRFQKFTDGFMNSLRLWRVQYEHIGAEDADAREDQVAYITKRMEEK